MTPPTTFDPQKAFAYLAELASTQTPRTVPVMDPAGIRTQPTVGSHVASLLELLIRTKRATRILEIGTSYGYAAGIMGAATAPYGGRVITIEMNEELARMARANMSTARLESVVEVRWADAKAEVLRLSGPFDVILQDGNKEDYLAMLEPVVAMLAPDGLLISDDILFPAMTIPASVHHWQTAMDVYNQTLSARTDLFTVWLPIGDGIALSMKK